MAECRTLVQAMASAGIIPGIITCLFSGSVAGFGLYLLSLCAPKAPHRKASFFTVAELTFPRAAVFFDAAIAIKCFGVSIRYRPRCINIDTEFNLRNSYLIIVKSLMPNVAASLYHDLAHSNPPAWAQSGRVWISILMLVLFPLSFMRKIDSLRHTSYVALFSVGKFSQSLCGNRGTWELSFMTLPHPAYLVVVVIVCYFFPLEGTQAPGEIHLIHFTPSFVSTFPVQVFAFTCAQNVRISHIPLVSVDSRFDEDIPHLQ